MNRRSIGSISALVFLALMAAPMVFGDGTQRTPRWSRDLVDFGFHIGDYKDPRDQSSDAGVAASSDVVAVAIATLVPGTGVVRGSIVEDGRWSYSLVLFDARNATLLARRGPWVADSSWSIGLYATSRGNFILRLPDYHDPGKVGGETLLLLSPAGDQLKELDLPPAIPGPEDLHQWQTMLSPTRSTVLVSQTEDDGNHYEVLDANTLEVEFEGTENRSDPHIVAISDQQMLGDVFPAKSSEPSARRERQIYIRPFHGDWRHVLNADKVSLFIFLSEHQFGGVLNPDSAESFVLAIYSTEGTQISSSTVQRKNAWMWYSGPLVQSPDGIHAGCVVGIIPPFSLWFDMGPAYYKFYVWSPPNPVPVSIVNVDRPVASLSFAPDSSWIALIDEHHLRVIPLPK